VLRVLSYNVNSGYGSYEKVLDEINGFAPDIVFLQEIGSAEPFMRMFGARFPVTQTSTQFFVASRFPVLATTEPERIPYGALRSPRFLRHLIETPLGTIAFYNVHPLSPREDFYAVRGGGLKHEILSGRIFSPPNAPTVKANSGLRELQVQAFAQLAANETHPVVIAGDTNLPGLSRVLNQYLSTYQDGFREAGWGFGYTFPVGQRWMGPWMRIDRILASAELRFVRFEVGGSNASDHHCVVADLMRRGL
jgi:endonuclease/exonuclease/phosphatase (EEP) superfamily protein YafD